MAWVSIDLIDHAWQRNLADTLADYLNVHNIEPKSVITLEVTEKYFSGVGWQGEVQNSQPLKVESYD